MEAAPDRAAGRSLGLSAATALVVGESVALGIFLTPAGMARSLGSPALLLAVWLAMAGMTVCGALCYAELAIRFPEDGGDYVYLRHGFGDRVAFLFGWTSSTVIDPGVAAAMSVGSAPYVAILLAPWIHLGHRGIALVPVLALLTLAAINSAGTRLSGWFVSAVNWIKMTVLFGLVGWTALSGHAHLANLAPWALRRSGSQPVFAAVSGATVSAFFAFGGWWQVAKISGQVRDYKRNLPRAFVGGVTLVSLLYLAVSFAFLSVIPLDKIAGNTTFIAQFGSVLFGGAGSRLLSACVLVAVTGGLSALTMASPRVFAAMAQQGEFFAVFGRLSRSGTPVAAILLQTAITLAVVRFGAFDSILSYLSFPCVLFLALTAAVLFRTAQPMTAWWYPAAPIVFIGFCLALALLLVLHSPLPALLGAAIVLAGDPLRRWVVANRRPA